MDTRADRLPVERGLEQVLLGGTPMFTQDEITAKSGVPDELGPQIWRALGFPTPPADVPAFTENDVRALQDIKALLDSEMVDEELVLHLSRAVGQTMGRLASWLGDVWIRRLADRTTDGPGSGGGPCRGPTIRW